MATKKVTQLPAANPVDLDGTCLIPVVDLNTNSVKATIAQVVTGAGILTALTGDVTTAGSVATIANDAVTTPKIDDDAVTFAKMQNIATQRLLGRSTAASGDVEELTLAATLTLSGGQLGVTPGGTAFHGLIMQRAFGGF